jgi:serine phosphatase RsbU (regulator of sigma subunit)
MNTATSAVTVSSGGAETPLIVRLSTRNAQETAGNSPEEIMAFGPLIGMTTAGTPSRKNARLTRGDLLLMFTDGLTEARRPSEIRGKDERLFFGPEGVSEIARFTGDGAVSEIAEAVVTKAKIFAGGKLRDDICLLIAAFDGVPDGRGIPVSPLCRFSTPKPIRFAGARSRVLRLLVRVKFHQFTQTLHAEIPAQFVQC